jgi:hypothetical protein
MPTNRRPITRQRTPVDFTPEALALFRRLEAVPARRRASDAFKAGERELARLLGCPRNGGVAAAISRSRPSNPTSMRLRSLAGILVALPIN